MAKTNWELHRKQYAKLSAQDGMSVREYAETFGLNANTCRREFKKLETDNPPAPGGRNRDQDGDQNGNNPPLIRDQKAEISDQNGLVRDQNPPKKAGDHPARSGEANVAKSANSNKNNKLNNSHSTGEAATHSTGRSQKQKSYSEAPAKVIKSGSAHGAKLGSRARKVSRQDQLTDLDYLNADSMLDSGLDAVAVNALRDALANMHHVQQATAEALEVLDQEIADMDKVPKSDEEENVFGVHPAIRKVKLLMDNAVLHINHNSMISAVIGTAKKVDLERRKVQVAEVKAANTSVAVSVITKAIELRKQLEWDDIQTVEYIESFGIKAPASMMARANKAIAELKPPVDETNVLDDAALDAEAQAYAEQKKNSAAFVEDRRNEVAALTDRLGMGDYDSQGDRKAGEMDIADESLEFDYEATSDLYGGDVPPPILVEGDSE